MPNSPPSLSRFSLHIAAFIVSTVLSALRSMNGFSMKPQHRLTRKNSDFLTPITLPANGGRIMRRTRTENCRPI